MLHNNFNAQNVKISNVGKLIKNTKKQYTWEFNIKNIQYELNLYHSLISKKHVLKLNNNILKKNKGSDFEHSFQIENFFLNIDKDLNSKKFILKINNETFDYLINKTIGVNKKEKIIKKKNSKKKGFYDNDDEEENNIIEVKNDNSDIFFKYINYLPIKSNKERLSLIISVHNI